MTYSTKSIFAIGIILTCIGCNSGNSSTEPPFPLDLRGTYRYQTISTGIVGDCSNTVPDDSGTMTFNQSQSNSFTVTACTYDNGNVCVPVGFTGIIEGNQVTLQYDLVLIDQAWHSNMTGPVTNTANFSLSGQGTKEPGACRFIITATCTKL